jgi:ATP-binding cassette, subfamily B, bacterial PglK
LINKSLLRLWHHIDNGRRKSLFALLCLLACASLAEVVTIGAIIPFLSVLTDPVGFYLNPTVSSIASSFGITDPDALIFPLVIIFILAAVTSGGIRFCLLVFSNKIIFAIGHDLSVSMYRKTLYQPYATHIAKNSSEVINAVSVKSTLVIFGIVMPVLIFFNSAMMLTVVLIFLIAIDPFVTLMLVLGFTLIYALIIMIMTVKLKVAGEKIATHSTQVIKSMQEGLGAIRDVLIDGNQEEYSKVYRASDFELRFSQRRSQVIREAPRYLVETMGLVLIASFAFMAWDSSKGVIDMLPILGALAFGCQRMLPVVQQAYSSWGSIRTSIPSLIDVVNLLDQPIQKYQLSKITPIAFNKCLSFSEVSFQYSPDTPMVLRNINLEIPKGSRVGIIGVTGGGKSSLLDVMMGLLKPVSGVISIDGVPLDDQNNRAWQKQIGHVPQAIFLSDASIAENIAYGIPASEINYEAVKLSAQQAQLSDVVETWVDQYQTRVGERGVKLSGGQRQRIGIARALYKNPNLIIFDEATSALDNTTEASLIEAIGGLSSRLTVVMVAHRLTTLKDCDIIFEIKDGCLSTLKQFEL